MRVEKAEDQVTADIVQLRGQLRRLLKQLTRPTIRSAICGCSVAEPEPVGTGTFLVGAGAGVKM